jgi:DNA-binding response OmpR family regulator
MNKARILIIEDDADVRKINQEYFEERGFKVATAASLAAARLKLEKSSPDIILLDVMMPDGLGWDFCKELRKKSAIPVIYLTCRDENESIVRGLLQGGDDYVTKPYDLDVLGARVAAMLRRAGTKAVTKIKMPPLYIDLSNGEVILSGERINLTKKEFQLLSYFALNAGQRLGCEEIFRHAWGDVTVSPNTIAVHITSLRKKMKFDEAGWFEFRNTGNGEYIFSQLRY